MQMMKFSQKKDMINMMTQVIATFIVQISFSLFILDTSVLENISDISLEAPSLMTAFTRFIAGICMHVVMNAKLS